MENDIFDSLEDLGYQGPLLEESALAEATKQGANSVEYTKLVEWIVTQLCSLCHIDEHVSSINDTSDLSSFLMELSGFLREYGCPYKNLSEGSISERLSSKESSLQLLDFLLTELMSVRMLVVSKSNILQPNPSPMSVSEQAESDIASHMKKMLIAIGFPKPPSNITPFQLFSKMEAKVKDLVTKYPDSINKPLLKACLSEKQWSAVQTMNSTLEKEYDLRRNMLLKRLDVTVQSFKWSNRAEEHKDQVAAAFQPIRKQLTVKRKVSVADLLAAREDLTAVEKITTGEVRAHTQCAVNKVLMGKVPDRGGRVHELQPPPPEMPAFMKRSGLPGGAPQQQRPRSGRGGRVQGGWSGGGYQEGGGGYKGGHGGGGRGRGGY